MLDVNVLLGSQTDSFMAVHRQTLLWVYGQMVDNSQLATSLGGDRVIKHGNEIENAQHEFSK